MGAEPQPHAVERLPGLQGNGLVKSFLGQVDDLGVVIVDDLIDRLVADPQLQVVPDPAAEQPDRSRRQHCSRDTADDAAQGELFFISTMPFWQDVQESVLLYSI